MPTVHDTLDSVAAATSKPLLLHGRRGVRITVDSSADTVAGVGTLQVDHGDGEWLAVLDEDGDPITLTVTAGAPASLQADPVVGRRARLSWAPDGGGSVGTLQITATAA